MTPIKPFSGRFLGSMRLHHLANLKQEKMRLRLRTTTVGSEDRCTR